MVQFQKLEAFLQRKVRIIRNKRPRHPCEEAGWHGAGTGSFCKFLTVPNGLGVRDFLAVPNGFGVRTLSQSAKMGFLNLPQWIVQ